MSVNDYTAPVPVDGGKNVAAAGTPERLSAASIRCRVVTVTARPDNTGNIAVGSSNAVRAAFGAEKGIVLGAGESATVPAFDAMEVWIDAEVNGEGVSYATALL